MLIYKANVFVAYVAVAVVVDVAVTVAVAVAAAVPYLTFCQYLHTQIKICTWPYINMYMPHVHAVMPLRA